MRKINDILEFRSDISPFLVHLTRKFAKKSPKDNLKSILTSTMLKASDIPVSNASYGVEKSFLESSDNCRRFFGAVCFTETPLNEIHCFLDIRGREVNLEPYGLVFLRDKLEKRGVSPVFYINNKAGDKDDVIYGLCNLIEKDEKTAEQILPLITTFGKKIKKLETSSSPKGKMDFRWKREWRYPAAKGDFKFSSKDIFVGLCPHQEIEHFENLYRNIQFLDPTRNIKWYATKLIEARQRLKIKYSVV